MFAHQNTLRKSSHQFGEIFSTHIHQRTVSRICKELSQINNIERRKMGKKIGQLTKEDIQIK